MRATSFILKVFFHGSDFIANQFFRNKYLSAYGAARQLGKKVMGKVRERGSAFYQGDIAFATYQRGIVIHACTGAAYRLPQINL
jgi:hypothetical protein